MNKVAVRPGTKTDLAAASTSGSLAARLAAFSALAFALGVVAANVAIIGGPTPESATAEAASWYEANRMRVVIANAMVALTFPALLVFGAAMFHLGRERTDARLWMLVGGFGAVAMVGVFSIVIGGNIAAVLLAGTGSDAFAVAWLLHNAAFAVNMSVLGTAFLGFTLGAHAVGLTPAWQRTAGVVGAILLLVTGFGNTVVAEGSPIVFIGFAGFLLWLVWLLTLGVRLVRN